MSLDDALARMVDRDAIIGRKLAFARAADAGDPDGMVECFSSDATAVYDPDEPISGRGTIRAWYAERLGPVVASSHQITNFEVDFISDQEAVLRCYLYSWQRFEPASARPDRHRWARYLDTWKREPDGWALTSLRLLAGGESPYVPGDRVGEYRAEGF